MLRETFAKFREVFDMESVKLVQDFPRLLEILIDIRQKCGGHYTADDLQKWIREHQSNETLDFSPETLKCIDTLYHVFKK